MNEFKVGDKVRCISTEYEACGLARWITRTNCKVGGVYDVVRVSDMYNIVLSNSHRFWLDKNQFEAV